MNPTFFPTPSAFREWLESRHAEAGELWVGYYKRASGRPSLTWPESVDQALCFGWIDGVRKSIDAVSYAIRFTPRRVRSTWSRVNIARVQALVEQGLMHPAGLAAFEARKADEPGGFPLDQPSADLGEPHRRLLKRNRVAWRFYQAQPPSYRRITSRWVASAKKEETRLKRLEKLIAYSGKGQRIPEMAPGRPAR